MSIRRLALRVGVFVAAGLLCTAAPAMGASPWWHMLTLSAPPNQSATEGEVVVDAANLGDAPASDEGHPVTLQDKLPDGLQVTGVHPEGGGSALGYAEQAEHAKCTLSGQRVTCTYPLPVLSFESVELVIDVKVQVPGAGSGINEATVSGGLLAPATQQRQLDLEGSVSYGTYQLELTPEEDGGGLADRAGSHPFQLTTTFAMNTQAVPIVNGLGQRKLSMTPLALTKDARFNLPPGLLGNATAAPQCADDTFERQINKVPGFECPLDTVLGVATSIVTQDRPYSPEIFVAPLYNLEPGYGEPARFGFEPPVRSPVILDTAVDIGGGDRGVTITSPNITQQAAFIGAQVTFWGWPADPRHDAQRGECINQGPTFQKTGLLRACTPSERLPKPYLTMPTLCGAPLSTVSEVDSWEEPGAFLPFASEPPIPALTACNHVPFDPKLSAEPSTEDASAPSGLKLELSFNDEGLLNPEGIAQSQINKTVVTLPEGMTVNPSAGVGLGACTPIDYERETLTSPGGTGCPEDSKLGTVAITSPLISGKIEGSVYIAQPYENPFPEPQAGHPNGTLLALYIVARNPRDGIFIKLAGKVVPDRETGRLTTIFEDVPQLPFDRFEFKFREGAQAPLITPPRCGIYAVQAQLAPWSGPGAPVADSSSFAIAKGFDEGPCPANGVPPFSPRTIAGTLNNRAGSYTPFYLRILRNDNEQELTRFTTILPPGLTANLTAIPFCPDAQIEAARRATGREEIGKPSCPAASEIGHTLVGAGVGAVLALTPGKVYLAGPYRSSALSIVSITSATVGPFDLGTVVIRFALRINPITAQAEIDGSGSDPIPHIIDGIVVHVGDIHVYIDRPRFMIDPTSCEPMRISAAITGAGVNTASSADDQTVDVSNRFQASDCASLAFKPLFKASTSGKTSRRRGATLHVRLTYPRMPIGSQANIHAVKVSLPKQLPSRLVTLQKACPDGVFGRDPAACPAASRVGTAKAVTPILPEPLTGPAYFVSHGGARFPELILVLQGYGITIDLHGKTFISKAGITSSTFASVPDEPVTSFELTLPQGRYSALAASGRLCNARHAIIVTKHVTVKIKGRKRKLTRKIHKTVPGLVMPTTFTAQNGVRIKRSTPISVTNCARHAKGI